MAVNHTTIRNGKLFCLNCGGEHALILPIPVNEMTKKIKAFNVLHKSCEKTWEEPVLSQEKSVKERAMFWISNGETGMSSKTMWNCFMNNEKFDINHPYDPDDFSRCYKLLQQIPEWKQSLNRLKPLSPQWNNLVDNWATLTQMYEQNVKEKWKNYKKIGMYEFMQQLIK
jgi:hypothetical protein